MMKLSVQNVVKLYKSLNKFRKSWDITFMEMCDSEVIAITILQPEFILNLKF